MIALDFAALCESARSQLDYMVLARTYHTVLLHRVKAMDGDHEESARRFLALVDEFYERRVKLIISAECDMFTLYRGDRLKFEYQRCLSRLQEMQSEESASSWLNGVSGRAARVSGEKLRQRCEKAIDLSRLLLYNLATPRYNKVFFPKTLCAGMALFEGVGLLDDGRVNLNTENRSVVFTNV